MNNLILINFFQGISYLLDASIKTSNYGIIKYAVETTINIIKLMKIRKDKKIRP